jgi:hypothetical protein
VQDSPNLPKIPQYERNNLDPAAIYFFIKSHKGYDYDTWEQKKWRWDANLKPKTKILNLSNATQQAQEKLLKLSGLPTRESIWKFLKEDAVHDEIRDYDPEKLLEEFFQCDKAETEIPTDKATLFPSTTYRILRLKCNGALKFSALLQKAGYDAVLDTVDAHFAEEPQLVVLNPECIVWGERVKNNPPKD